MTIKELVASLEGAVLEGASWDTPVVVYREFDSDMLPIDQVVTLTVGNTERIALI